MVWLHNSVNTLKTTELYSFKGETLLCVNHISTKLLLKNNNNQRSSLGFIIPKANFKIEFFSVFLF